MVETLVKRRDQRRDSFAAVMKKAMTERLGSDADEVTSVLSAEKIPRQLIKDAMELAQQQAAFTIFALVDALTKLSQRTVYAGDRTELDTRIGQLLALAASLPIPSESAPSPTCCTKASPSPTSKCSPATPIPEPPASTTAATAKSPATLSSGFRSNRLSVRLPQLELGYHSLPLSAGV